jgi:hypothetical protein
MNRTRQEVPPPPTAVEAWSRRLRRVGGLIQLAFATFWLLRGALTLAGQAGLALAVGGAATAITVTGYGLRVSAGVAPNPTGADARRIGRAVTVCTVVQLIASFAAPVLVTAAGHPEWVLPSVAITIGLQLLWFGHRLEVPRYRLVGWALTLGPAAAPLALSGRGLAATVSISAGALLLITAVAGFRDLARLRPPSRPLARVLPAAAREDPVR